MQKRASLRRVFTTVARRADCRPSACGCSSRVRSGLQPREDHASNLVGPVRDIIGLLGLQSLAARADPGGEAHRTRK